MDKLVLTIEVDGIATDDWRANIESVLDDDSTFEEDLLMEVTETLARPEVHVVFCGVPGEQSMNDDFEVFVKPGRIVGAALTQEEA